MPPERLHINAVTFAKPLGDLAETLAQKLYREGRTIINAPDYVFTDLFVQLRFAKRAYDFLFYLNADERRIRDCYWSEDFSLLGMTAVRTLIDVLYNVTTILLDPIPNGERFRLAGILKLLLAIDEDRGKYAGRPEWRADLENRERIAGNAALEVNRSLDEVRAAKAKWKTLGSYLRDSYKNQNEQQLFLHRLTLGSWSEYSALAHATFEGLIPSAIFFVRDILPQEDRSKLTDDYLGVMSMHLGRAATVLLCLLTEIQARFSFSGANFNTRLLAIWQAVLQIYEANEFYEIRYRSLMESRGIIS